MLTPLSDFIRANLEPILAQWEGFARTLVPESEHLSQARLRDYAQVLLLTIADDMETTQSPAERKTKSEGHPIRANSDVDTAAEIHALDRLKDGFSLNDLIAEFRALRACVIRLWTNEHGAEASAGFEQLIRFDEAIDQALSESVARYTQSIERSRDLLLASFGHDLRNPLSAMLTSAQVLLRSEALDSTHIKTIARIVNSGSRIKGMISDLLDFAGTRLGDRLALARSPMDIGEACQSTIDEIATFHPHQVISLHSDGDLMGCWDPTRVAQLLSNLIGNAVDHGNPGAPIRVEAHGSEAGATVTVWNDGAPIPESARRRLFEPLSRGTRDAGPPTKIHRSLGLGLYIACEITKAHGGSLKLASSDESGTVFSVWLPR